MWKAELKDNVRLHIQLQHFIYAMRIMFKQ